MSKNKLSFFLVCISTLLFCSHIWGAQPPAAPKAKVIVAKSGGNYTTITAALNAITPGAATPYVIEVWPGTYNEQITMKSYVHLMGSGRDVTTVQSSNSADAVTIPAAATNVAITGLTVTGGYRGIVIDCSAVACSTVTVSNNTITQNAWGGIIVDQSSPTTINENNVTNNGGDGIAFYGSSITISDNVISGNSSDGIECWNPGFSATLVGNVISNNGSNGIQCGGGIGRVMGNIVTGQTGCCNGRGIEVNFDDGVCSGNKVTGNRIGIYCSSGMAGGRSTVIGNDVTGNTSKGIEVGGSGNNNQTIHNRITGNGVDISASGSLASFNVFDTLTGTITGAFNVKSDGVPWP